jgi:hypothetical protein
MPDLRRRGEGRPAAQPLFCLGHTAPGQSEIYAYLVPLLDEFHKPLKHSGFFASVAFPSVLEILVWGTDGV